MSSDPVKDTVSNDKIMASFGRLIVLLVVGLPLLWFAILMIQFLVSMIGHLLGFDIPVYMLPWEDPK